MRLIVAGGGTGGHINPAIAISNEVLKRNKDSRILFIGTKKGLESSLVPKAGYNIEFIDVEGFLRIKSVHNLVVVAKFSKSILKCISIIKKFRPDVVVGTGGYVSAPVLLAAKILGIPTLIHEQNAVAGKTSKMLSKYADRICVAFGDKNILGHPQKTVVTGNPVREGFKSVNKDASKKELGFEDGLPVILCVSGSLGAQKISEYMTDFIKENYKNNDFHLVLVTGDLYYHDVLDELKRCNINLDGSKIHIKDYIYNMEKYLSAADLVISRSGAIALSEIAYLGKPSILIPSPNVAENHQEINADNFVKYNAAVKICERDLSKNTLKNAIFDIIGDEYRMQVMSHNAYKLAVPGSSELIVNEIESILHIKSPEVL